MSAQYTPAASGWVAVVSGSRAVLLEAGDPERIEPLLVALDAAEPVSAVLDLLMRDGLGAMPAFGFAALDDGAARVLVRGEVSATLGDDEYRGSDYSTWGEHRAAGTDTVVLAVGADHFAVSLPLGRGAAFATTLRLGVSSASEQPPVAAGAPPAAETPASPIVPPVAESPTPAVPEPEESSAPTRISSPPVVAAPSPSSAPVTAPTSIPEQTMVEFTLADADPGYSHLFEETIVRPIEHAAVRDDEAADEVAAPAIAAPVADVPTSATASAYEEHDGMTIVSGDLAALRAAAPPPQTAPIPPSPTSAAPAVPELRFSTGLTETLTAPIIIGRSPSTGKVSAGRVPRLVTITDDPDLSRSHVQIEMQGDAVVVTDLHSRNGTTVALPGRAAERLRGGVPTTVIDMTVIDLGGGLTIQVREPQGPAA
ncbi:FHA domain-containing protein [Herbiconiux sp. L3-i23]|uniref:FHA domain-containing protein n=1 Tax=Herbiconiux sp. L3-i23 TaxID=2905871 RepID=UPI0020737BCE|nr:FHA domain-containing protein [Herbiconiux sp. L3-i23]